MELYSSLHHLERADLVGRLQESASGAFTTDVESGDLSYLFKHALVQETAYTSVLKNRRKRLHRMIGECLERAYPEALQENAARLTQHYIEAGDNAKIIEHGERAGDAAAGLFAKPEAIEFYRVALDAALRLGSVGDPIIRLATKLGREYELADDYTRALETYALLDRLATERQDLHLELAALMLQATLRATPTPVFDPRLGREICDRALALARQLRDGAAEAKILWNLLLVNGFTGHHQAAVEFGEQSLALARALNLKTQIAYTLNDIGNYGYFANGQPDKARAALAEARALWRELEILPMLADNLNNSGILEYIWGNLAQARAFSDQGLEVSERIDSSWGRVLAHSFRGVHNTEVGNYGGALAEMRTAYDIARRVGSGIVIIAATNLALVYGMVGEIEAGYNVIQIANADIEIPLYRAPAKSTLAYLTLLHGDAARAEMILQDAHPHPAAHQDLEFSYLPSIIAEGEIALALGRPERVVEYTTALVDGLLAFGIQNFVADAELYRGRALTDLKRYDDARAAFERGLAFATRLGSLRASWQIYAHWGNLEVAAGNLTRAAELHVRARELIDSIAATLPDAYRGSFVSRQQPIADCAGTP